MTAAHDELWDLEALAGARRLGDWMFEQFADLVTGGVVEIGAGIGTFTQRLLDGGAQELLLIEPEEPCAARLRERFGRRRGVEIVREVVPGSAALQRWSGRADLVLCQNVLEHVPDHGGALAAMADALAPGGTLGLLVPAHPRLYGALDRKYGHERRYTRPVLRELCAAAGLEIERLHAFNALGVAGWLAKRWAREPAIDPASLRAYELLLPPFRALERLHPPPFGLSLVLRARRPGPRGPARPPRASAPAA